jgi:hypothetical protein
MSRRTPRALAPFLAAALPALLWAGAAAAQPPPTTETGARPGREPGVGISLPVSPRASNIGPGTTRAGVAPSLPAPAIGPGAEPEAYLQAAREALRAGRTGLAQESLERAETQMLHRSVTPGQAPRPADSSAIATLRDARLALDSGDTARALAILENVPAN